jgi:hypothetical protein
LVTARSQSAFIANPGPGTTVYIYIINLERKLTPSYTVTVNEVGLPTTRCTLPIFYPNTYYCLSCPSSTTGVFCSIANHKLSQGKVGEISLQASEYGLFTLLADNDAKISFETSDGGVSVYFQYNQDFQETAGLVNYVHAGDVLGHSHYSTAGSYSVELSSGDSSVAMGILNMNTVPVTVRVSFTEDGASMGLIIALSVLGGLLGLGIIATIVIVVKKMR